MNIEKHTAYWKRAAEKAFRSVPTLLASGYLTEALFFAHLAIESALKAQVVRQTRSSAPRIHNLLRLSELAKCPLDDARQEFLVELNEYQMDA